MNTLKLTVLFSGFGATLQALIDNAKTNNYEIINTVTDNSKAFGIDRAKYANIPCSVLNYHDYPNSDSFNDSLLNILSNKKTDLIILAGYMRILPAFVVQQFPKKIINIHPSLLPKYKGLNTHAKVLAAGDSEHGCTIHIVTKDLDAGPILAQAKIPVDNDTIDGLTNKVKELEQKLYPDTIGRIARGELKL